MNQELSNEFDVLYDNITSNQAPGLDEYEKSLFLTKAQDELIKSYINPKLNKVQEGFDDSKERKEALSMLVKSAVIEEKTITIKEYPQDREIPSWAPYIKDLSKSDIPVPLTDYNLNIPIWKEDDYYYVPVDTEETFRGYIDTRLCKSVSLVNSSTSGYMDLKVSLGFFPSNFDMHDNACSIILNDDILAIINDYVEVTRRGSDKRLIVLPINYNEYSRIMESPFKWPLKNQAWRLSNGNSGFKSVELVIGPGDIINKYIFRYIKRPRAIRLTDFTDLGLTIGGGSTEQSCELDPILWPELVQRAVELAKAVYMGDLTSQIALGQNSHTDMGVLTQSK